MAPDNDDPFAAALIKNKTPSGDSDPFASAKLPDKKSDPFAAALKPKAPTTPEGAVKEMFEGSGIGPGNPGLDIAHPLAGMPSMDTIKKLPGAIAQEGKSLWDEFVNMGTAPGRALRGELNPRSDAGYRASTLFGQLFSGGLGNAGTSIYGAGKTLPKLSVEPPKVPVEAPKPVAPPAHPVTPTPPPKWTSGDTQYVAPKPVEPPKALVEVPKSPNTYPINVEGYGKVTATKKPAEAPKPTWAPKGKTAKTTATGAEWMPTKQQEVDDFYKNIQEEGKHTDLPMDEPSRVARAKEQGFDTDRTLYHGTGNDFLKFNVPKGSEPAVFLTDQPNVSESYAKKGATPNIIPIWARMIKPKTVDFYKESPLTKGTYNAQTMAKILKQAKQEGHDSVIIKNIKDIGSAGKPQTQYAFFHPNQNLRAKYGAAFDPKVKPKEAHMLSAAKSPQGPAIPEKPTSEYKQEVSDDLHRVQRAHDADQAQSAELIKGLSPELKEAERNGDIYAHMEGRKPLDPKLQQEYDAKIVPRKERENELYSELKKEGLDDEDVAAYDPDSPDYVHRISADHPNPFDKNAVPSDSGPAYINSPKLPRTTNSLKDTKYVTLENDGGQRVVASENADGTVSIYNNKSSSNIGKPEILEGEALKPGTRIKAAGQEWNVVRSKTDELEVNTNSKYHKYGILNTEHNIIRLETLKRSLATIKAIKNSKEFAVYARPSTAKDIPYGWERPKAGPFKDTYMQPNFRYIMDDLWKSRDPSNLIETLEKMNRAAISSMFWTGLPHKVNIALWAGLGHASDLGNIPMMRRNWAKAVNEVKNMGPTYRELLKEGSSMQYARTIYGMDFMPKMMKEIGVDIQQNPSFWKKALGPLGVPFDKIAQRYKNVNEDLWKAGDVFMMQKVLNNIEKGMGTREAIKDAEKFIPNYRAPSEILGERKLAEAYFNPHIAWFSRYHYNELQGFAHVVKDAFRNSRDTDAMLRVFAVMSAVAIGYYGGLSSAPGFMSIPVKAAKTIKDYYNGDTNTLQAIANSFKAVTSLTPIVDLVSSLAINNGKDDYGRDITQKESSKGEQLLQAGGYVADKLVPPLQTIHETYKTAKKKGAGEAAKEFGLGLVGVHQEKPYHEKGKTAARNLKYRRAHPRSTLEELTD